MRRSITAFAVLASLLVVTAMPAAAAVASSHTTASDFLNATDRDDTAVIGNGDSATVELPQGQVGTTETASYLGKTDSGGYEHGWVIVPEYDMRGLTVTTGGVVDPGTAYLRQPDGTLLDSTNVGSQDTVTLSASLSAGTKYYITVDTDGGEYDIPAGGAEPRQSRHFDVPAGVEESSTGFYEDGSELWTFTDVTPIFAAESDGYYLSAAHTADGVTGGYTNLTLENTSASVTWQQSTDGGNTWTTVASSTFSTTGNHSLSFTGDGQWRVNVSFAAQSGDTTAHLNDEGVTFDNDSPSVDNSSASPDDDSITSTNKELSIDVTDPQFGTAQGEEVTVAFYVDGSQRGTDTLTSNGTASYTLTTVAGGSHEWHAEASDSYAGQATSDTFNFTAPGTLYIRDETNTSQLVDNARVELRFYYEGEPQQIVERNTTDGTLDMSGLPADRPFVVVADTDGYNPRRVYKRSLIESQSVYLLPDSTPSTDTTFVLEDYSGNYPPEDTVMQVERALENQSGSLDWRVVVGDYFGATGQFPTTLQSDTRHRLVLINTETGDERTLGSYTPTADGAQTVLVTSDGTINVQENASVQIEPGTRSLIATDANQQLGVSITRGSQNISTWTVTVTYTNDTTNTTLVTRTGSGDATVAPTLNLSDRAGGEVQVTVTYTLESGGTGAANATYRVRQHRANRFSLLSVLGSVSTQIPDRNMGPFTTLVALFTTVIVTGAFATVVPASSETTGLVAVATISGFALVGWVGPNLMFAAGAGWVAMAALRRGV